REAAAKEKVEFHHGQASAMQEEGVPGGDRLPPSEASILEPKIPFKREERKVGRNEPCPCGSGKKFKQCHGKI
ncbi:MAG: SEC-C metal-binding domain-containing protein, partial [Pseudomonadales bacterium]